MYNNMSKQELGQGVGKGLPHVGGLVIRNDVASMSANSELNTLTFREDQENENNNTYLLTITLLAV